jgi:hypothetical protein
MCSDRVQRSCEASSVAEAAAAAAAQFTSARGSSNSNRSTIQDGMTRAAATAEAPRSHQQEAVQPQ